MNGKSDEVIRGGWDVKRACQAVSEMSRMRRYVSEDDWRLQNGDHTVVKHWGEGRRPPQLETRQNDS